MAPYQFVISQQTSWILHERDSNHNFVRGMLLCLSLTELLQSQTHIPRGLSGKVSRMAVGIGAGTVGAGVGATERTIANHIKLCSEYAHTQSYQDQPLGQFVGMTMAMKATWQMKGWKLQGNR